MAVAGAMGLALAGPGRGHAATAGVGRVAQATGALAAVRGDVIVTLHAGDQVFLGDILRTAPDAKALIVCGDGLRIAFGPDTELVLRRFVGEPATGLRAVLGLLRGIARLVGDAVAGGRAVEVDTPTAVASVRSTEWLLESSGKGTGVLAIVDNVTVAALAGGTVELRPGEGTDVPPGGPPRPPALWGEARRQDALRRTTL